MYILQTLALISAGFAGGSTGEYAWPLSLDPQLTSSFAEYRTGRFHAGIDLRTAGVGREVFAAGDGYVSRVRCSPYGYGKAVYLQLHDGNSAVYAHLSDFYPELAAFVRAEQHRKADDHNQQQGPEPTAGGKNVQAVRQHRQGGGRRRMAGERRGCGEPDGRDCGDAPATREIGRAHV